MDTDNSKIVIDEEVGSGGSYNIKGHNNSIKLSGVYVNKIVVTGHNNVIRGGNGVETIKKLVILGHNNIVTKLQIKSLEICGHNNNFKSLHLYKQPSNNGFHNKFSNVDLVEEEDDENITYDAAQAHQYEYSIDSSDSSDSDEYEDDDE